MMKIGGERWNCRLIHERDYQSYQGIILMYNYCLRSTFEKLDEWLEHIRTHCSPDCVVTLVEHKYVHSYMTYDREVSVQEGREYAASRGIKFSETEERSSLDDMFLGLANDVHVTWKDQVPENVPIWASPPADTSLETGNESTKCSLL